MTAQEKFQHMLKAITPTLKKYGYTKRGTVFRKRRDDNWGVIAFIKDKWNTQDNVSFSIEIAVYSLAIDKQLGWDPKRFKSPSTPNCHWRENLKGSINTPGRTFWWDVDQYNSVEALTEAVKNKLLNIALPEIDSNITDEQLKNHCLAGGGGGLTEFNTLRQLSILLKLFNEKDKLEQVLQQLEQNYGPTHTVYKTATTHIKKMRE